MGKKTTFASPLEEVFDLPSGSTTLPQFIGKDEIIEAPTEDVEESSNKQMESNIVGNIDNVYDAAMQVFEMQSEMIETVDPKFAARNAEVANAYLNTALQAMKLKTDVLKERRASRKGSGSGQTAETINNNVIVANRNDVLRALMDSKKENK